MTWRNKKPGWVTKGEHDIINRLAGAGLCVTSGCTRPARVVNARIEERENVITHRCKDHETFTGRGEDRTEVLMAQNRLLDPATRPTCSHPGPSGCGMFCVPDASLSANFRAFCCVHDAQMREEQPLIGKAILAHEAALEKGAQFCEFEDGNGRACLKVKKTRKSRAKGGPHPDIVLDWCDHHRLEHHRIAHEGPEGMPQVYWLFE